MPPTDEIQFCTFRIFQYGARSKKKPLYTLKPELFNGHVHLRSVTRDLKLSKLFLWSGDDVIDVSCDDNGLTFRTFAHREVYNLKGKPALTYDREEKFSGVSLETVKVDFNLGAEAEGTWDVGTSAFVPKQIPRSLKEQLQLLSTRHTFRAEASRRTVISLLVLNAMCHIDDHKTGAPFLALDDEFYLREIRDTGTERVQYSGLPDYIVGHSRTQAGLVKDTALVIIEAKKDADLKRNLAQVLSQACVVVDLRRAQDRGNGEYKTYWLLTDGINWIAGYVRPTVEEKILYGFTSTQRAPLQPFDEVEFKAVYDMLCSLLDKAKSSTRRGSSVDLYKGTEELDVAFGALYVCAQDGQGKERTFDGDEGCDDEDEKDDEGENDDGEE